MQPDFVSQFLAKRMNIIKYSKYFILHDIKANAFHSKTKLSMLRNPRKVGCVIIVCIYSTVKLVNNS